MHLRFYYIFIIVFSVSISSTNIYAQNTVKEYIEEYADLAVKEMKRTGIPASITLAQGILESDAGNSRLATKANNHFGIKCHANWRGKKIYHDDDAKNECFRKYKSVYESYKDHSDFIKRGQRYQFLFDYKTTDYKSWAKGLKKAGYATDRKYADNLIRIIETYNLHQFDSKKYAKEKKKEEKERKRREEKVDFDDFTIDPFKEDVTMNNGIECVKVEKGQTVYAIAEKYDMMQWQLIKYNDLDENATIKEGQILYLQPKRNKASIENKIHVVAESETLYDISQKYGVKMKKLMKKNHLKNFTDIQPGDTLNLRRKKRK